MGMWLAGQSAGSTGFGSTLGRRSVCYGVPTDSGLRAFRGAGRAPGECQTWPPLAGGAWSW
eukprot:1254794-Alexandrium_andersonii.AAC.1